jgi:hypothetical protein
LSAEDLSKKYIAAMEKSLQKTQRLKTPISLNEKCVNEIFSYVQAYLEDAKYFLEQKKFETSLISIAYCEGLLDSLKLMGAIKI